MRRVIFLCSIALAACTKSPKTISRADSDGIPPLKLQYANGFSVRYEGRRKVVEVVNPFQGAAEGKQYILIQRGDPIPLSTDGATVIEIPLRSIVCTSTTHIPMLDYLGETDKLVGFPTPDYISSAATRRRIDAGKVMDLGVDASMNMERLASLHPDMVMGYLLNGDYSNFSKMESLGIPVALNAEYLESHPLGRAEWIKFMALFFNKEREADSIFRGIEQSYLSAKAMVASMAAKPTVLSGVVYGDAWFLPGGNNYAARLFRDAGCSYLWADDPTSGFLELAFESVYARAHDADFWIGVADFPSLDALAAADNRYRRFRAFVQGNVYSYDARKGATGGNEYLELGYLRPDLVLKDLIRITHPDALPGYRLYFHRQLN